MIMRFPLKAILIGVLVGAALFFAPFRFPFFFFFIFLFFWLSRAFFWGGWRRGYGYPWHYPYRDGNGPDDRIPVDGRHSFRDRTGGEQQIPVQ